jgi:hypothetical protein
MPRFIKYELEDGGVLYVEAPEKEKKSGLVSASRDGDDAVVDAEERFEKAIDSVRASANTLLTKLQNLAERPDEMEVTFGLKASGELGGNFFIAKAGTEASYTVKLAWKKPAE